MDQPYHSPRSHLFLIRIWSEDLSEDRLEWRGQVQHVTSGQSRYFRDWQTLVTYLQDMLLNLPGDTR